MTTKEFLNHLYNRYGQLIPQDLKINDDKMNQSYNATTPIEALDVAIGANAPYNETQILNVAYNLRIQYKCFPRDIQRVEKTSPGT